jgi:hypothetical protein
MKLIHTPIGRNTLVELVEKLKFEITDKNIIIKKLENDLSKTKKNETENFSKLITLYTEIREAQLRITQLNGENSNLEVSFTYECLYLFIFMNTFMFIDRNIFIYTYIDTLVSIHNIHIYIHMYI